MDEIRQGETIFDEIKRAAAVPKPEVFAGFDVTRYTTEPAYKAWFDARVAGLTDQPPPMPQLVSVRPVNRSRIIANSILCTLAVITLISMLVAMQAGQARTVLILAGLLFSALCGCIGNRLFHWLQKRGLDSKSSGGIVFVALIAYSTTLSTGGQ